MKIILRHVNAAAPFGDEGMRMTMIAARVVELQARTAGKPDRGDPGVIERGGELIEAGDAFSAGGNQVVDPDVEDVGCLAQAVAPGCSRDCRRNGESERDVEKSRVKTRTLRTEGMRHPKAS